MYRNPFSHIYDVSVFGGGLCAIAAALEIARAGHSVIVIERRPQTGWEITSAFNCFFPVSSCVAAETVRKALLSAGGWKNGRISPPIAEIFFNDLLEKAGVDLLLYTHPLQVDEADGLARAVFTASKSGVMPVRARVVIDATEESCLWRQAGGGVRQNTGIRKRFKFFFNGVKASGGKGVISGGRGYPDMYVDTSVWKGERCVDFEVGDGDISTARIQLPGMIKALRENHEGLRDAFLTHTSYEMLASDVPFLSKSPGDLHPGIGNLIACGIWSYPDKNERDCLNTLPGRFGVGRAAGILALKKLSEYGKYNPGVPVFCGWKNIEREIFRDVVISGGGTAGAVAGISAGRKGAGTVILEESEIPGGMGTGGSVHNYYHGVRGGLQDEVDSRVNRLSPVFCGKYKVRGFHPEAKKVVLESMCREAGTEIIFNAHVAGATVSGGRVVSVRAVTPNGIISCRGGVFIDSTGDGDVAYMAGASFRSGRDIDGLTHAYTQSAGWFDRKNRFFRGVNFDAGHADSSDVSDLTRARRRGVAAFYRKRYTESIRPIYISPLVGIRQGRNILGDYTVTFEDEIEGRRFEDGVGYIRTHYDNHAFRTSDVANQDDKVILWTLVLGNFLKEIGCEIPYRSLLPRGIEGLIMGCRAVSATDEAHFIFRVQRDMQRIGEAAGIAAAIAAKGRLSPRRIDVELLRKELVKTGALDERLSPGPAVAARPFQRLKEIFLSDDPGDAVYFFSFDRRAVPFLIKALKEGLPMQRYLSAVALAMQGRPECVDELIRSVKERDSFIPEGLFTVASWKSSIIFLGRAGDERALPVLLDILKGQDLSLEVILFTLRALERIGSRKAAGGILRFLKRKDIPAVRMFYPGSPIVNPVEENVMWQVDLSAARVLRKLGKPRPVLAKKYLDDPRSYVRKYAAGILK